MVVGQFNPFEDLTIIDKRPNVNFKHFDYFLDDFSLTDCTPPPEVDVPNVFSPNGDGINDLFSIQPKNVSAMHCQIFSRWGNLVFESEATQILWNGTHEGKMLAAGVYFYILSYTGTNGYTNERTGTIHLLK